MGDREGEYEGEREGEREDDNDRGEFKKLVKEGGKNEGGLE